MATKTHNYEKDPQSGAGNCKKCGGAQRHVFHPHKFLGALHDPSRCVCSKPQEHIVHFI